MIQTEGEKLQKYISSAGLMSRREAEKEILKGFFYINGEKAKPGQRVNPKKDIIKYKGKAVTPAKAVYYVMYNKPPGVITTMSDDLGRAGISDITGLPARLYPVGRLDKNSEGLLILTNDGEFANRLSHPRYGHKKSYLLIVNGKADKPAIEKLRGISSLDGSPINPVGVRVLEKTESATKLIMTLSEGKNRQIRRMCEEAGLSVMQLKRFAIGGVYLGELKPGSWRMLTNDEIKELTKENNDVKTKGISKISRR